VSQGHRPGGSSQPRAVADAGHECLDVGSRNHGLSRLFTRVPSGTRESTSASDLHSPSARRIFCGRDGRPRGCEQDVHLASPARAELGAISDWRDRRSGHPRRLAREFADAGRGGRGARRLKKSAGLTHRTVFSRRRSMGPTCARGGHQTCQHSRRAPCRAATLRQRAQSVGIVEISRRYGACPVAAWRDVHRTHSGSFGEGRVLETSGRPGRR